jgi:hypothetical protein
MIATTTPSELAEQAKLTPGTIEAGMLVQFTNNSIEDSLTAAVFSHLLHLPSDMFWRILRKACYSKELPQDAGEPKQLNVRPKWTYEATWRRPDLFIRFDDFDLIIEAKKKDDKKQSRSQWEDQFVAYTNKYGKEKPVRMIALGGIHIEKDDLLPFNYRESAKERSGISVESVTFNCPVHMCRWSTLLLECNRLKRDLEEKNEKTPSPQTYAHLRILTDLIAFFAAHGYPLLRWFADFNFKPNLLDDDCCSSHQQYFRKISHKLQLS